MPQKVKIQTGFSEKTSENYNSQQYSVSLEMECQINGSTREIEDASKRLFSLCRKIVNAQKGISVDNLLLQDDSQFPQPTVPVIPLNQTPATSPAAPQVSGKPANANQPKPATQKQLRFLHQLGRKSGLSIEQVNGLPSQYFQKSIEQITSQEASTLIDILNQRKAA